MKKIICYTDGACSYNPGPGGFGIIFLNSDNINSIISVYYGGYDYTTNNRMELTAVLEAIKLAIKNNIEEITIYSDSAYVINAINNNWIYKWQKNNWINSKNTQVKNKDLWLKYLKISNQIKTNFEKVKGHDGEKFNEIVDKLAVQGSKDIADEIIKNGDVNYVSNSKINNN